MGKGGDWGDQQQSSGALGAALAVVMPLPSLVWSFIEQHFVSSSDAGNNHSVAVPPYMKLQ